MKPKSEIESRSVFSAKSATVIASSFLLGIFLLSTLVVGGLPFAAGASQTYNNVQIFVHPTSNNLSSYSLTAYNSTGYVVASSTSEFPAFGLELPSGTYLFTVTASQYSSYYPVPYASGVATAGAPTASSSGNSGIAKTLYPYYPEVEYGYLLQQVSSSGSYDINTASLYNVSTTKIQVHVAFANGTAAQGVSVQGSIVGGYYYGGPNSNNIVMWNQTAADGSATLVLPAVPVEVSAWIWLPVNLPKNITTVQTTVGGEPVNVTVYWSPSYVGLAGSQLILPPANTASITLHAQQPNYWVMPYGVQTANAYGAPSAQATMASGPGGIPAAVDQGANGRTAGNPTQQTPQISPITASATTTTTTYTLTAAESSLPLVELLSVAVVGAILLAAVGLVFALRRK